MTEHKHLSDHHCVQIVPLFSQLSSKELAQVEQTVHHREVSKGEIIINPYATPQLTIVAYGALKMYQLSSMGKEQLLRVVEPGGYEGENALFGVRNENLFGEALQATTVCFLRQSDFRELLLKYPKLSLRLLEINAKKSAQTQQQSSFLMMDAIEMRLATYLLDLAKAENSSIFQLPMKMKELATFLGTSPETLSRKIKLFEDKGLLEHAGRSIKVLDAETLKDDYC